MRLLHCFALLFAVSSIFVQSQTCRSNCNNNNECYLPDSKFGDARCSRCLVGICVAGLPCGSPCLVNTDCDQTETKETCRYCIPINNDPQNKRCGGIYPPPTQRPTTERPTEYPTTQRPTEYPTTQRPTEYPTTQRPTEYPTSQRPTGIYQPTQMPTLHPTSRPTERPTSSPTERPTTRPTERPTSSPTERPTERPTLRPTERPTPSPANAPANFVIPTKFCDLEYRADCLGVPDNLVSVPLSWKPASCADLTSLTKYQDYELGCVGLNAVSTGLNHAPPKDDVCRWNATLIQPIKNGENRTFKTCSAVYENNECIGPLPVWDTITVQDGWTPAACINWTISYHPVLQGILGCFFVDGTFSFGTSSGGIPNPDCGWRNSNFDNYKITKHSHAKFEDALFPSKICIVYYLDDGYRTTLNVPDSWTVDDCANYAMNLAVNDDFAVGCIFNNTYTRGSIGGLLPNPNCGW